MTALTGFLSILLLHTSEYWLDKVGLIIFVDQPLLLLQNIYKYKPNKGTEVNITL